MAIKKDQENDISKLEIPAKDSLLFSEITRFNLSNQKRQKELSCDSTDNGTLSNTLIEMTMFRDREENIEKIDQDGGNLSLFQSDSPLVDILSSLLKDEEKFSILRSY